MFLAALSQNSECFILFYHKIPNDLARRITFLLNLMVIGIVSFLFIHVG